MSQGQIIIRFPFNDFMKYQDVNNMLPPQLIPLCNSVEVNEKDDRVAIRGSLIHEINNIIDNVLSGVNPNDIVFKNNIREYLNKINAKTYQQYVDMLKNLNYSSEQHFAILTYELLIRSMTDTFAIKGLDMPKDQKSLSDIYADICGEFASFFIKDGDRDVKFLIKLLELCEKTFSDFVDQKKPLDSNNMYRVDHFKGFMNLLGLLFSRGLLSHKITLSCACKLKDLIFKSEWGQQECDNVFNGYKRMINQILTMHEKKYKEIDANSRAKSVEYLKSLQTIHNDIDNKNKEKPKLRKYTMLAHKDMAERLHKIINVYNK